MLAIPTGFEPVTIGLEVMCDPLTRGNTTEHRTYEKSRKSLAYAATLNGVLLSLGLGAVTYWAKETVAGRETSDDPAVWAVEAVDWSGLTGWLMDANGGLEKATRGTLGLSMITGKPISRYATRNAPGALLGPTLDAASDIFQATGAIAAGDFKRSDLHTVRQLIPAQNLFWIRTLFDRVEAATGDALGLPDTAAANR
ncbi:MAG: hypothetical protein E5W98_20515 [Mesorhizobium sp.]|nr:MAG: hypothetical protein E5W98_20515 [Mesorhizobium sp.]